MRNVTVILALLLLTLEVRAAPDGVRHWQSQQELDVVYDSVYKSLEENRFYVVFEPNIGANLAGFAERWGEDYNRNQLTAIRAMVFCNGWYANQVSNLDPLMMALCPLHITLYAKAGVTHVVFVRPGEVAEGSAAQPLLREVEQAVAEAIEAGLQAAAKP